MYIAVDAMGGDYAPRAIVEGAVDASREYGIEVLLVGNRDSIARELKHVQAKESSLLAVQHATETISMSDSVAAMRNKRDSSLHVAFGHVKSGNAGAVVSAGNSGAVLALAITSLGRLKGVERPAIVTMLPTSGQRACLIDSGANVECKPQHLIQFAIMGEVYARVVHNIRHPRVGVLSNGEEDSKGTEATRVAHEILKRLSLNYVGYIEGRDLNNGNVDVIVTDGFTGNVVLKTMEGFYDFLHAQLRSLFSANWQGKLAYLLLRHSFASLRASLDADEIGGAPLLGTKGLPIIAHGASTPKAIKNAIRLADESVRRRVNDQIMENLNALSETALLTAEIKRGGRNLWTNIRERFRSRDSQEADVAPEGSPSAQTDKPEPDNRQSSGPDFVADRRLSKVQSSRELPGQSHGLDQHNAAHKPDQKEEEHHG